MNVKELNRLADKILSDLAQSKAILKENAAKLHYVEACKAAFCRLWGKKKAPAKRPRRRSDFRR